MKAIHVVYAVSFGLHVVGVILLDLVKAPEQTEVVNVTMTTVEKPQEEKEKPKPPDPPPPTPVARPVAKAAPPKEAPPPETEAPPPAPDFGFVMSGGPGGGVGGIAVPTSAPPAAAPKGVQKKLLAAAAPAPEDNCSEAETKPKATSMPHPTYTDDARAAAIEGKVRVELTLTPEGTVADAKVIEGLGHGLDEAAIEALKQAKFTPATKCGKPVAATFTVSVRFAL